MARKALFNRLPAATRRMDQPPDDPEGRGVLERFLSTWDGEFDQSEELIRGILELLNVDAVPDRFLRALAPLVGYEWDSDLDYDGNRRGIRDAVALASMKGSARRIRAVVRECGGEWCEIVDMASKIGVWSAQGRWNCDDSHYLDADWYHPGVVLVRVPFGVDYERLVEKLEGQRRRGWDFRLQVVRPSRGVVETVGYSSRIVIREWWNRVPGRWNEEHWNWERQPTPVRRVVPVVWRASSNRDPGVWNESHWNWGRQPTPIRTVVPTVWRPSSNRDRAIWNESAWNWENQPKAVRTVIRPSYGAVGALTSVDTWMRVDRTDVTVDMGTPENPLPLDIAGEQPRVLRIVED